VAGKGEGIEGRRSGLWFEMWRIIRDLRPRWVIAENVGAITFRGLDRVLSSLAEIGYDAEWTDIRASDVGAPHRRERIWICAYPSSNGLEERRLAQEGQERLSDGSSEVSQQDVADTGGIRSSEMAGKPAAQEPQQVYGKTSMRYESSGPSQLRTQTNQWATEPSVCSLVDGLPSSMGRYQGRVAVKSFERVNQLKALGNSIVPAIAEMLFRQIKWPGE